MNSMKLEIGEGLEGSVPLCRYFSFEAFINLIETELLTFTAVSNWEDPWENELARYDVETENGVEKPIYSAAQHHFGQCWTKKLESDAMWRIYSPNLSGVKLYTKIDCLKSIEGTERIGVEKVVYFSDWRELSELTKNDKSRFLTAKYKRIAFSHEEEVRFFVHPQDIIDDDFHGASHINLPINVSILIDKIEIDPRAPVWVENMIKTYVKRRLPNIEIRKSSLYERNNEFRLIVKYAPVEDKL